MIIGLGELGLNPEQMYEYTLQEFVWKIDGVRKMHTMDYQNGWEQTRDIMYLIAQMAGKTAKPGLTKYHVLKFTWDKDIPKSSSSMIGMNKEEKKEFIRQKIEQANAAFQNFLNNKN